MPSGGMRLGAIDLNLLVVFDALMQDRSVTRAGKRLGLSQSAVSHALTRLRHMLGNDLFVRTPKGMVPTPRAEELAPSVRTALGNLQRSLERDHFTPETATDVFRIAVDNYSAAVMVAPMVERVARLAPKVRLHIRPSGTLDLEDMLDRHELDLAIGCLAAPAKRFSYEQVTEDKFVVMLNKSHPALKAGKLSLKAFARLQHVQVSSDSLNTSFIDEALARRGLQRDIAVISPFLSTVRIVGNCNMVSVFPGRVAAEMASFRPLAVLPLPIPSPTLEWGMIWPRWLDHQPAHVWLRKNIVAMMGLGRAAKSPRRRVADQQAAAGNAEVGPMDLEAAVGDAPAD
jgi:DNA-binding transcriptional LysR family regulator